MTRTADVHGAARNWEPYILTGSSKDFIPRKYAYGAVKITDYATLTKDIIEAPERPMNSRSGRIHLFPPCRAGHMHPLGISWPGADLLSTPPGMKKAFRL